MKKIFTLLLLVTTTFSDGFSLDRYVIQLTDKANSPYSLSNPSAFLSAKAIARRALHNIAYDQKDLPVNPSYLTTIANTGALVLSSSKWLNTVTVFTTDQNVLNAILALPFVTNAKPAGRASLPGEKDQKFNKILPINQPNSTVEARSASFDYGLASNQIQMLNGDFLHNQGFRGEDMTIAVLDAGFLNADTMACFDSLISENRLLGARDFVNFDTDVFQDDAHGSEVLSLMAGNYPGHMIGTAPKANYWLLRSEDGSSEYIIEEYNWATAAEFADSVGADIINTSLGYTEFWDSTQNHTYAGMDGNTSPVTIAADIAASKGILVECSAGNEGASNWNYISSPADGDSVLTTGAVDNLGAYAAFSSNGPTFDGRVKPNIAAQGQGAYVYLPWGGGAVPGNGTSFSGPIIAGMAACLWQAFPMMSNMQIISAIEQSASQFNNPDTLLGYGIPDFAYAKTLLTILEAGGNYQSDQLIKLYPNPYRDKFTFSFFSNSNQQIDVEIMDILGKKVYQTSFSFGAKSLNKMTLNPNGLSNGLYFLRLNSNDGVFTERLLKL